MAMLKPLATHLHRSRGLCSAVENAAAFQVIPFSPTAVQEDVAQDEERLDLYDVPTLECYSGDGMLLSSGKHVCIIFTTNCNVWSSSLLAIRVEAELRVSSVIQRLKSWTSPRRQVSARTQSVVLRELLSFYETFNIHNASCSKRSA